MILYKDSTILAKIFEKQGGGGNFNPDLQALILARAAAAAAAAAQHWCWPA